MSVVICTHNGAARLPATLAHLAAQKAIDHAQWEVVVVDNASADGSAQVARDCWPPAAAVSLRVIEEPRLGLSRARLRGLAEARYEIVSFVDDDNWLADDWVAIAAEVLSANPDLGAIGSLSYPVCETDPPEWFVRFQRRFFAILT
ncbi:MAG: glycosyltransferase, partial [Candidatus Binataceae bacterium]